MCQVTWQPFCKYCIRVVNSLGENNKIVFIYRREILNFLSVLLDKSENCKYQSILWCRFGIKPSKKKRLIPLALVLMMPSD